MSPCPLHPNRSRLPRAISSSPPTRLIEACGGDAREAVKALLVAVDFLESKVDELKGAVSNGYARGRYVAPHDRKE